MQPAVSSTLSSQKDLISKITYIQNVFDPSLRITLDKQWSSVEADYRQKIREYLATKASFHFSRQQLAWLNNLLWRPEASDGYISISHCKAVGGFSFSDKVHGFDCEQLERISVDVLRRTASEEEFIACPRPEFLWCAKEAAFKAFSQKFKEQQFVITQFVCKDWENFFENKVFKFKIAPNQGYDSLYNEGYVFSFEDVLFAVYYY